MTDEPHLPEIIETEDGIALEAAWSGTPDCRAVAVLTHPHPRYGGDMHNLVPASLARSLPDVGVATLRVNFRGTGRSTGSHGDGRAEIADVRAAVHAARRFVPDRPVLGIGYSFGADVVLSLESEHLAGVVAIAPPLAVLDPSTMVAARGAVPTLVLSAEHDQFCAPDDAARVVADWPGTRLETIPGADHSLAGATSRVATLVTAFVDEVSPPGGP